MAGLVAAIRAELAQLATLGDGRPSGALLTPEKAAEYLGVSRATVFRLMTDDPDLQRVQGPGVSTPGTDIST